MTTQQLHPQRVIHLSTMRGFTQVAAVQPDTVRLILHGDNMVVLVVLDIDKQTFLDQVAQGIWFRC